MTGPLTDSVALLTGASRGLGAALAVELAQLGAHVVITARTQGGLEDVDDAIREFSGSATLLALDLQGSEQIDLLGPSIVQRFGRLDILVHCAAALGELTPTPHIEPKHWAAAVSVNMTAAYRLIRTCDPPLRTAPAGRAVFATDVRARSPKAYWGSYTASKAGMEHLVLTWADEVRQTRLRVNLLDPGTMRTRLRAHAFPGEDPASQPTPDAAAKALTELCLPGEARHGELVSFRRA
jgi:NAD(P)-dependent dehydrogenase (short-subunit alcohol dehydrogenase family)